MQTEAQLNSHNSIPPAGELEPVALSGTSGSFPQPPYTGAMRNTSLNIEARKLGKEGKKKREILKAVGELDKQHNSPPLGTKTVKWIVDVQMETERSARKKTSGRDGDGKKKSKDDDGLSTTSAKLEREASLYFIWLKDYIEANKGHYLQDEDDTYQLLLKGKRIALNFEKENHDLNGLLLNVAGITLHVPAAKPTIARLMNEAHNSARKFQIRRFSAMSEDRARLYIPVAERTKLLEITEESASLVSNGENKDSIWVEHPEGAALKYTSTADPKVGLDHFKRLLADTQATKVPEMRWLVAMHEGFFPFIRDLIPARFILSHIGGSQQGKTSGAQRFTLLHGLGMVKGDYSPASLGNLKDIGLLVMDNKEQSNLSQQMVDYLLFLSTGAERGRSDSDGNLRVNGQFRPVGVITSIEGVHKKELKTRNVEVEYSVPNVLLPRAPIESEIKERRFEILSSMMPVLQKYMAISKQNLPTPNPIPAFEEHFSALCNLLRAFGEIAGMTPEWAEGIVEGWNTAIVGREPDEDELEQPVWEVLRHFEGTPIDALTIGRSITHDDIELYAGIEWQGKRGRLYVTETAVLLMKLKQLNLRDHPLPRNTQGLGRRLHDAKFQRFAFVTEEQAPELTQLKRTTRRRPVGFFVPNDLTAAGV